MPHAKSQNELDSSENITEDKDSHHSGSTTEERDPKKHDNVVSVDGLDNDDDGTQVRKDAFGKKQKIFMWIGIAVIWTVFELDNAMVYNYQNYATSEFKQISALGALATGGIIISGTLKPSIAKISDVIGRAETYCAAIVLYLLAYILTASANHFDQYATAFVIYNVGQTGMQIMNQLIVADITTSRCRGLANAVVNLPFLVIPWIAAFIADSAIATVGWRWGIGMFAIIFPVCATTVVIPLFLFQRRMKQLGVKKQTRVSLFNFMSETDLGGMVLLTGGFALLLLPLALAGTTPSKWSTPWVPALMAVGAILLGLLVFYEGRIAAHPLIPLRFLRNISLVLAWTMGILDSFAFAATHVYIYPWSIVVHSYSARDATFLAYAAGCMQVLTGLGAGSLMYKTRYYKWLLLIGVVVRLIGYGVMMRLRGANNSTAEIFIVQLIQGVGSGLVQTIILVIAQIVVPRSELSQSTGLVLLIVYMANALGSTAAGAIYTNTFVERLHVQLPEATKAEINDIYNTFEDIPYAPGSSAKEAINRAYSDVMRYMTLAALGASVSGVLLVWFLPNLRLNDKHNLAVDLKGEGQGDVAMREGEGRWRWWWRTGRLWQ